MTSASRAFSSNREYRDLIEIAEAQGWIVTMRRSRHLKWTAPDGWSYFSASTPSDHRAIKNLRAALVRHGLDLLHKPSNPH